MSNLALAHPSSLPEATHSLNQSYDNCQDQVQSNVGQNKRRQQRISMSKRNKPNQNLVAPQVDKKFPRDFFASHDHGTMQVLMGNCEALNPTIDDENLQVADLKNILVSHQKLLSKHNQMQRKQKNQQADSYSHKSLKKDTTATISQIPSQFLQQRSLGLVSTTKRTGPAYEQMHTRNQSEDVRGDLLGNFGTTKDLDHYMLDAPSNLRRPIEDGQVNQASVNNTPNTDPRHNICSQIDRMLTDFNTYTALSPQQQKTKHRNYNQLAFETPDGLRTGVATSIHDRRLQVNNKFSLPHLQPRIQATQSKYINNNENIDLLTRKVKNNPIQQISSQQLHGNFSNKKQMKSFALDQLTHLNHIPNQNQLDPSLFHHEQQPIDYNFSRSPSCPQSPVAMARQELQRESNQVMVKMQVAANAQRTNTHRVFTTSKKQEVTPRLTKKMKHPQRLPSLSAQNNNIGTKYCEINNNSSVKKNLLQVIDQDPYKNLQVKPFSAATADQNGSAGKKRLADEEDKVQEKRVMMSPPSTTFGNGRGFFDESTQISSSVQNNQFDISSGSYTNAMKAFTSDMVVEPSMQNQINKKRQLKGHFEDLKVCAFERYHITHPEEETLGTPTFKKRESTFEKQEPVSVKMKNRFSNYRTQTTGKLSGDAEESIQNDDLFQSNSIDDSTFNQIGNGL